MGNSIQQPLAGSRLVDQTQTRRVYFCQGVYFARYNFELPNVLVQPRLRQIQARFSILHRNIIRVLGFSSYPSFFCGDSAMIQIYTQHFPNSLDKNPHLLSDYQVGPSLSFQVQSVKCQYLQRKLKFAVNPRLRDFQLAPGFQAKYLDCVLTGEQISFQQNQNEFSKTIFFQQQQNNLTDTRKSLFSQSTQLTH